MTEGLLKTPLYDAHVARGARMVDFSGWLMPVTFSGVAKEHVHTREACSVFDVSHMGRIEITGKDAERFLNHVCTRNLTDAETYRSYYSHVCKEDGGILDDVIVSRFEDRWGLVCNGSNREKIVEWLTGHARDFDVSILDNTLSTAMLAIQGPRAIELAGEIAGTGLLGLNKYRCATYEFMGMRFDVYRGGYTGEDGFEVVLPAGAANLLLPNLLGTTDNPHPVIQPAGLGARDTLRIEAGMPLYGHELSENIDTISAGQGWCADLSEEFIGVEALREINERGALRRLVGLELDGRRIVRQHCQVYDGRREVGMVTSGTLSPTLNKSIAMAYVVQECANENTELEVDLKGKRVPGRVVKLPFYTRPPNS